MVGIARSSSRLTTISNADPADVVVLARAAAHEGRGLAQDLVADAVPDPIQPSVIDGPGSVPIGAEPVDAVGATALGQQAPS